MKKTSICFLAAALVLGLNYKAITGQTQPPPGVTGAPGESNCSSCHPASQVNPGLGQALILNLPAVYVPGTAYPLGVSVTDASKLTFGFELTALTANNQPAGTFTLLNTHNTVMQTAGGKTYISHRLAGSNTNWTFIWTAPAPNLGPVTFYLSAVASDNNQSVQDDHSYAVQQTTYGSGPTGLNETDFAGFNLFPNPASQTVNVQLPAKTNGIRILDLTGKTVFNTTKTAAQQQVDIRKLPAGTYFMEVKSEKATALKRFLVQHH